MSGIYGAHTITLPLSWLVALATSDLRLAVYALRGLYGVFRFLHLVGMAAFVGMVVILDLRGLGLFPPASLDPIRSRLGAMLRWSFRLTNRDRRGAIPARPAWRGAAQHVPA